MPDALGLLADVYTVTAVSELIVGVDDALYDRIVRENGATVVSAPRALH